MGNTAALQGWLLIDTAPRGVDVLVYWPAMAVDEDGELTGEPTGDGHIGVSRNDHGGWEPDNAVEACGSFFDDDYEYAEPTHWMALPAPPAAAAASPTLSAHSLEGE